MYIYSAFKTSCDSSLINILRMTISAEKICIEYFNLSVQSILEKIKDIAIIFHFIFITL